MWFDSIVARAIAVFNIFETCARHSHTRLLPPILRAMPKESAHGATNMTTQHLGLTDCIGPQLARVYKCFHDELASEVECVNTLVRHISRFRGKMLRPTLLLLAGKACGELTDA